MVLSRVVSPNSSSSVRLMAYHALRRTCPPHTRIARRSNNSGNSSPSNSFHTNSRYLWPSKDAQDKDSLNPRSTEYSKTGSDDSAASDTAFDPSSTRPETEQAQEGESDNANEGNPLDVSPSNKEVSNPRDPQEGGADKAPQENRNRTSGHGSANKAGGGKSG